eukprot:TRINITY_DN11121_c0_g1_i1.p1 TRINITY_DN11121_c0_g1~~TRINITY_DN11121_c0_g1_i1.p1  ORF type:complete len:187 (-),score=23.35 TRINITY_DN11121_c0_g1_i1:531-1091(-)
MRSTRIVSKEKQLDEKYESLSESIKSVKSINTAMPSFEPGRLMHILNKSFTLDRYFYCGVRRMALLKPVSSESCELEGDLSLFRDYCCNMASQTTHCQREKPLPLLSLPSDATIQVARSGFSWHSFPPGSAALKKELLFVIRQYLCENDLLETAKSLERETNIFFDLNHIRDLVKMQDFETLKRTL